MVLAGGGGTLANGSPLYPRMPWAPVQTWAQYDDEVEPMGMMRAEKKHNIPQDLPEQLEYIPFPCE